MPNLPLQKPPQKEQRPKEPKAQKEEGQRMLLND
jgi:hypothetical protein